jgi:hypothetical protein
LQVNPKARRVKRIVTSVIFMSFFCFLTVSGQEGVEYDLKKPPKYENRTLGYEKSDNTKFNVPRRFTQNSITHYNFYFNTNVKLNEILTRAKLQFKDDYTQLLPFYNYNLETTSKDKRNLDSVIDKINTSILIHDLRNDWNDNMYMLMGRAYFYKNNLDSAHVLFQFVNYAYAPREKDGYPIPIGSNSEEGGNAFTVSTNEKRNIIKKTFSQPPSRNESLVWLIRVYITQDKPEMAAALIDILNHDPNFPARLQPALHEMQALWFYNEHMYDSAAIHLSKALDNATSQSEQARWEFLIGQLYERSMSPHEAKFWYEKAASHTLDASLEVYARLNAIRQNKGDGSDNNYIQKNLDALKRMARKEIYEPYLDVIYYASAEMELERNDRKAARLYFQKCIDHALGLGYNRDRAFLKLGWIFMQDKSYVYAKYAYDSINTADPQIADSLKILMDRKLALNQIVPQILTIQRQDSLQRIAAMTPEERDDYLKKQIRNYHKQQGIADEQAGGTGPGGYGFVSNSTNTDMFGAGTTGEWYFYNPGVKSKGFGDFKSKWGNRPNVDNWFAQSVINKQITGLVSGNTLQPTPSGAVLTPPAKKLTTDALLESLPLTPEKLKISKDSVENALFALGRALQDYIPDYQSAIARYDTLLIGFPETRYFQEALFNEYYCYLKLQDSANASRILALMKQKFPTGRYLAKITDPNAGPPDKAIRVEATFAYEKVYEELIEGKFDEAAAQKIKLDSLYGQKYWTPQLMYVEALYYIHYRYDSIAKVTLNNIIVRFGGTAMSAKAKNTLRVLNERERIENYLRNLHITRAQEDSIEETTKVNLQAKTAESPKPAIAKPAIPAKDSSQAVIKKADSIQTRKQPVFLSPFIWSPQKTQSVALVMTKVDPVYVTESKNAFARYNRENYYGKNYDINLVAITDTTKMMVIHGFDDAASALTYLGKASNAAPRDVIPWLPATKYFFIIIDDQNLEILKTNKDMSLYKKFLLNYSPDKFPQFK